MHSDWTRQQSFSDWLFVPRLPFWGLLWISASPSPLFCSLCSFLSTPLYLVDCRQLSVWCECVWLAKTEPAVGSSVFLLMEWYSMRGSLPIVTLCDKWSVKLGLINKMSKNYHIWQMWWGRFETPATDTCSQMHCWPSRECLIEYADPAFSLIHLCVKMCVFLSQSTKRVEKNVNSFRSVWVFDFSGLMV